MKDIKEYSRDLRHALTETLYEHYADRDVEIHVDGELDAKIDKLITEHLLIFSADVSRFKGEVYEEVRRIVRENGL